MASHTDNETENLNLFMLHNGVVVQVFRLGGCQILIHQIQQTVAARLVKCYAQVHHSCISEDGELLGKEIIVHGI